MNTKQVFEVVSGALKKAILSKPADVVDAAILGSVSGHYGWQESRLIDVDVWFYAKDWPSSEALRWLNSFGLEVGSSLKNINSMIQYEVAAIDGPYKSRPHPRKDTVLLHLLIDDEISYSQRSPLTRYSWRKYRALIDAERLLRLAPARPSTSDLLVTRWGVHDSIRMLSKNVVTMSETELISGKRRERIFGPDSFAFQETCTYSVMMTARNIVRIDGYEEPDCLPNFEFVEWYRNRYVDDFVREIYEVKQATSAGQDQEMDIYTLRDRVLAWLRKTEAELLGRERA